MLCPRGQISSLSLWARPAGSLRWPEAAHLFPLATCWQFGALKIWGSLFFCGYLLSTAIFARLALLPPCPVPSLLVRAHLQFHSCAASEPHWIFPSSPVLGSTAVLPRVLLRRGVGGLCLSFCFCSRPACFPPDLPVNSAHLWPTLQATACLHSPSDSSAPTPRAETMRTCRAQSTSLGGQAVQQWGSRAEERPTQSLGTSTASAL